MTRLDATRVLTSSAAVLRLACICLLLLAQQTALTHSTWHAAGAQQAQQRSGCEDGHERDGGGADAQLCMFHFAMSSVTGGTCGGGPQPSIVAGKPLVAPPFAAARLSVEAVPAVSRGPPERS